MISKMGLLKQAAFAVCLVASVGAMPLAHADGFGISVATGPGYYNGYNNGGYYNRPATYPQRCFRNYEGYVVCRRVYPANYYNGAAYFSAPVYYNGYNNGYNGYNGYNSYNSGYNGSYGSGVSLNYYGGRNHRYDDRRNYNTRDRDDDNRWQR